MSKYVRDIVWRAAPDGGSYIEVLVVDASPMAVLESNVKSCWVGLESDSPNEVASALRRLASKIEEAGDVQQQCPGEYPVG